MEDLQQKFNIAVIYPVPNQDFKFLNVPGIYYFLNCLYTKQNILQQFCEKSNLDFEFSYKLEITELEITPSTQVNLGTNIQKLILVTPKPVSKLK